MREGFETRQFHSKWITAPEEYLETLEEFPELHLGNGKWIWACAQTRSHLRREFFLETEVTEAFLEFWCDNLFDLYVNGREVSKEQRYSGCISIGSSLVKGKNILAVRAYQTDSPLRITSAIRGCVVIRTADGEKQIIGTDERWKAYEVSDFWASYEPEDWAISENPGRKGRELRELICSAVHPRLLRRSCWYTRTFYVQKKVKQAWLYATARGCYECYLNGKKCGDAMLAPGVKEAWLEYQRMNVTRLLQDGNNEICALLGNGWYNCSSWGELTAKKPCFLGELVLVYEDGEQQIIGTDESWRVAASPLLDNDLQFGERYDARLETDTNLVYAKAESVREERLVLQDYPPVRITEKRKPLSVRKIGESSWLFDFGVCAAGRAAVKIRGGDRGNAVRIRYYERILEDGTPCIGVYTDVFFPQDSYPEGKACWNVRNMDVYIKKGPDEEIYKPRFTYTGFRYVCLEGCEEAPHLNDVTMLVMHNDLKVTGTIKTDNQLINSVWEMITRSYRSNIFYGPTDCPTREKNFWNGDIQVFAPTACWYMDNSVFLSEWSIGGRKLEKDVYGWEDEEYILPLTLYQFYGNKEILKAKFSAALQLLEERDRRKATILPLGMRAPYRDQLAVENGMSSDFFASCYYCYSLKEIARMAAILGEREKEIKLLALYEEGMEVFQKQFYQEETGDFGQNCQGGQLLPLGLGLVAKEEEKKVVDRLMEYIKRADYHLTTGFMTTEMLFATLCDHGYGEIAWKIFRQEDFPSWGYLLKTGATSITENWEGCAAKGTDMSMNHFALGSIGRWFFEYLGGIRVMESSPGFEQIVFQPLFIQEMEHFEVCFESVKGTIRSGWYWKEQDGKRSIHYEVQIPEGCRAEFKLPKGYSMQQEGQKFRIFYRA